MIVTPGGNDLLRGIDPSVQPCQSGRITQGRARTPRVEVLLVA